MNNELGLQIAFFVIMGIAFIILMGQALHGVFEATAVKNRFIEELSKFPAVVEDLKEIIGKWEHTQIHGFPYERKQANFDAKDRIHDVLRPVICKLSLRERSFIDLSVEQSSTSGRINYLKSVLQKI